MMVCSALNLADYIVEKCARDNQPISNLQLNRIMYFLQCVYCRSTKGKLLFLEHFEAWSFGPILPEVYHKFQKFGGSKIDSYCKNIFLDFSKNEKFFIDEGIEILRKLFPWSLIRISNAPGSPWEIIYKMGKGHKNIIPNSLLIETSLKNK